MDVEGKEKDVLKAQIEISQEAKLSENVKEDEVGLKEDEKFGEGNGETKKVEVEEENRNGNEKGEFLSKQSDGNEGENVKESGKCSVPAFDGNMEEIKKVSEKGECSSQFDANGGEASLISEENGILTDLKEYERKALRELRSKIEEAILTNKLSKELNEEKKEEESKKDEGEAEKQEKDEEKFKEEGGSFVDKGKEKVEEEKEEEKPKEVEKNVETNEDISVWGVPLLPSKGDKGTDVLLFKFLRAREFRVNDAYEMLKNTLEWRKENRIDSILDEDFGNEYDSVSYMKGIDFQGHPVCYNVYGVFANDELCNKTFGTEASREKFLRWRLQMMEKQIQKLDFRPGGVLSLLQINDLKNTPGPSRKELRLVTKRAVGILQDNYPEFVSRNIFVNVPFWYYAFNALLSPFLTQRTKSKFVFARPSRVTETLLKYIAAEEIPIQYGGLLRENDPDFSTKDVASEVIVKAGATETIEIPAPEVGKILTWDLSITGWDVNYKEEFVPTDEGSYTIIVKKERKISWEEESIRNTFKNNEPGKLVITIENGIFKKKRVLYRYKIKDIPSVPS